MIIGQFAAAIVVGYLLGSIPFGALIAKRKAKVDVTQYGSGKTGTTNVMRVAGSKMAAVVGTLDVTKGALAVLFAGMILGDGYFVVGDISIGKLIAQTLAALAAIVGHIKPVFCRFQGGRGVATYFGGLAVLCPPAAIFGSEMLVVGAGLSRYVSLGSIAGVVSAYVLIVTFIVLDKWPVEYLIYVLTGTIIIMVMHRDNISRLMSGKERKLGEKVEKREPSSLD
ncbi:glycerol-3-phosphate 1-O-acyltransferase PlsY [Chloroflexota bacterium]